jgi:hypothetical protein
MLLEARNSAGFDIFTLPVSLAVSVHSVALSLLSYLVSSCTMASRSGYLSVVLTTGVLPDSSLLQVIGDRMLKGVCLHRCRSCPSRP